MSAADESTDSIAQASEPPVRAARSRGWSEERYQAIILAIACGVLAASALLRVEDESHVVVPYVDLQLPGACMFRNLTGLGCPGCGLTRSFISLAHGQWSLAWSFHPLGWVFFGIALAQIPLRVIQLRRLRRGQSPIVLSGVIPFFWVLFALLIGQWIVRGIAGRW